MRQRKVEKNGQGYWKKKSKERERERAVGVSAFVSLLLRDMASA